VPLDKSDQGREEREVSHLKWLFTAIIAGLY